MNKFWHYWFIQLNLSYRSHFNFLFFSFSTLSLTHYNYISLSFSLFFLSLNLPLSLSNYLSLSVVLLWKCLLTVPFLFRWPETSIAQYRRPAESLAATLRNPYFYFRIYEPLCPLLTLSLKYSVSQGCNHFSILAYNSI